mgnify:CR=1 FL=1
MADSTDIVLHLPAVNRSQNKRTLKQLQVALRRYLERNPYNTNPRQGRINAEVSLGTLGIDYLSLTLQGTGQAVIIGACRMCRHQFDETGTRLWVRTNRYRKMKRSAVICINFNEGTVTVDRTFKEFLDSHQKEVTPALVQA